MWGFLKCNYSYTKILIVLLSPSLADFFFQGRVIPPCGPARAAPGRAPKGACRSCVRRTRTLCSREAARGLGGCWGAQTASPQPPTAATRLKATLRFPREGVGLKAQGPGLCCKLRVRGSRTWDRSLGGNPGGSLKGHRASGNALAAPVFQSAPASLLQRQPDRCFTFYFLDCSKMHIT